MRKNQTRLFLLRRGHQVIWIVSSSLFSESSKEPKTKKGEKKKKTKKEKEEPESKFSEFVEDKLASLEKAELKFDSKAFFLHECIC